ncbi:PilZ domain-containing protein [Marinomonas ushuaiensis]|nr:PilZ domain-containing protein [Marinomonas ushuaiensis]
MVDLEILTPTSSKRVKTEFVGLLENQFIILNYPSTARLAKAADYLPDGATVVVRALIEGDGGQIIAFRQLLLTISFRPSRLLFIAYPKQVQLFSLRSQTRVPTLLPAKLKLSNGLELTGLIKDISLTGVMFEISNIDKIDNLKDMKCSVIIGNNKKANNFEGAIRSVKPYSLGARCGIKLSANKDQMKNLMREYFIEPSVLPSETRK